MRFPKATIVSALVLSLSFVFAALSFAAPGYPLTVVDDTGAQVVIKDKPQRIASITLMTDDILLSLVEKDRIVAVTTFAEDPDISNVASQVIDIPNKIVLNVEVVLDLNPDLVFVANWSKQELVEQLRKAGIPVYLIETPVTVDGIMANIAKIARMVGEEAKGDSLIKWMETRLGTVAERVKGVPAAKRVSVIDYGTWGAASGAGTSWDEIVRMAGLENAVGRFQVDDYGQVPVSKEKLIEIDPDIVILPGWVWGDAGGADKFFKQTVSDPAFRILKSVKEGRVHRMPESTKTCTSQYIVFAVEHLAKLGYPELFQ